MQKTLLLLSKHRTIHAKRGKKADRKPTLGTDRENNQLKA